MSELMRVDSAALRDAGAGFGSLATSFDAALSALLAALDAEAGSWGQDEIGAAFANSYLPAAEEVGTAWAGLTRGVLEVGEAVVAAASTVDQAENRAESRFGGGPR